MFKIFYRNHIKKVAPSLVLHPLPRHLASSFTKPLPLDDDVICERPLTSI